MDNYLVKVSLVGDESTPETDASNNQACKGYSIGGTDP